MLAVPRPSLCMIGAVKMSSRKVRKKASDFPVGCSVKCARTGITGRVISNSLRSSPYSLAIEWDYHFQVDVINTYDLCSIEVPYTSESNEYEKF